MAAMQKGDASTLLVACRNCISEEHNDGCGLDHTKMGFSSEQMEKCQSCVTSFDEAGGCNAWHNEDWAAVEKAVPAGCYECEAEAASHCDMPQVTAANSLIQALAKHSSEPPCTGMEEQVMAAMQKG